MEILLETYLKQLQVRQENRLQEETLYQLLTLVFKEIENELVAVKSTIEVTEATARIELDR